MREYDKILLCICEHIKRRKTKKKVGKIVEYTHLLFDIDDTILNFQTNEQQALRRLFYLYGIPYTEEKITQYQIENHALWKQYEQGIIDRSVIFEQRFNRFFALIGVKASGKEADYMYRLFLDEGHDLLPQAKEVLQTLKERGYHLLAATNGVKHTQYRRLREAGVLSYFECLYISEELGVQKPDIAFFRHILEQEKITEKEALMIGDTPSSDIAGGRAANIDTVFFDWKNPEAKVESTYRIHQLKDLETLLK